MGVVLSCFVEVEVEEATKHDIKNPLFILKLFYLPLSSLKVENKLAKFLLK